MTWQTVKTVLWSAIGGAIVWWIVLGVGFGWMSAGRAEKQANERAQTALLDALTPICVANFEQATDREAKLAALKEASSWRRDDFVIEQGWAIIPGAEKTPSGLAAACVNRILASTSYNGHEKRLRLEPPYLVERFVSPLQVDWPTRRRDHSRRKAALVHESLLGA